MVAEPLEKKQQPQKGIPDFRPGDTVRVHIKVIEGESERIQMFEGTVISRRGSGEAQSFTVRKISFGVGVERTFPLSSPHIDRIEVVKSGRVRRARLYYLRNLTGKAARLNEQEVRDEGGKSPTGGASAEKPAPSADGKTPEAKAEGSKKEKAPKSAGESSRESRALGAASAHQ